MSSFLRKVAGAFVVLDDGAGDASREESPAANLDDLTRDAAGLLTQLEPSAPQPSAGGAPGASAADASPMAMTAEDVFRAERIVDDANSAPRVMKLIAGLTMFPREQQLAMVRAMDAADDSWAEPAVVADARRRQDALRQHLTRVAEERARRTQEIADEVERTRQGGAAVLAELDRQIAALHARREQEAQQTASALAQLEVRQGEVVERETRARQGISQVIQALVSLLAFLGAPERRPGG